MSAPATPWWVTRWERAKDRYPLLARCVDPVLDVWAELSRIELVDRSLALGAQALLALIPLLMILSLAAGRLGAGGLGEVQYVMGVPDDQLGQLVTQVHETAPETTTLSVIVAILSATSFSRALSRMYARAWHLERYRGIRALRGSVVWLVGWVMLLQVTTALIRWSAPVPVTGLLIQLLSTSLIWWWTAHFLLGGRVSWWHLLPGAVATGSMLVVLSRLSHLFMPAYTRANREQFGSLGIVFAVASWLVMFGGVLIVATVAGRFVTRLLDRPNSPEPGDAPEAPAT